MDEILIRIDKRFDYIDKLFDEIDQRLDKLNAYTKWIIGLEFFTKVFFFGPLD